MTSFLSSICAGCGAPHSNELRLVAKDDLRPCGRCLTVMKFAVPEAPVYGQLAPGLRGWSTPAPLAPPVVVSTGAAVLRLRDALARDPSIFPSVVADPDRHWLLQLPALREAALEPFRGAPEVRLARDAQVPVCRDTGGRNYL
jgi:hypothetical protein